MVMEWENFYLFCLKSLPLEDKYYGLDKIMEKVLCILGLLLAHSWRDIFNIRRHSPACLLYLQGWHNLTYLVSIIDSKYDYMFITAILIRPLKLVGQYHLR